jgi:hypothetical protein
MSDETKASKAKAQAEPELETEVQGEAAASEPAQAETAQDAPDAEASRTGYADKGARAGDPCTCPDGRSGTVHSFDAGLICIPNHEQG